MTAQLSKGPPSPPAIRSKWSDGLYAWTVEWVSSSGSMCRVRTLLATPQVRTLRVTTLRRDYEEIK